MPWIERWGEVMKRGGDHVEPEEWEKVDSMWPLTSRTLKPTLDQSEVVSRGVLLLRVGSGTD